MWKQPTGPLMNEQINCGVCLCVPIYRNNGLLSSLKILLYTTTLMNLEEVILIESSQTQMLHDSTYNRYLRLWFVQWSYMDVRVGLCRKLSAEKLLLLNCSLGEDSWESLRLQGDQSWVFTGRIDAEAETPVFWQPHAKSWLIGKDPDAGRDWGQEEKGMMEDEMAGWHHQLDEHEFEKTPGAGDAQGGLACCDSWGHKQSDTTERLNWK